jgi:sulfur relay (sulfurtransferase) DsrF/TusC family protein
MGDSKMPGKKVCVMLKSKPFSTINYYEGLRNAAGLWEHQVSLIWMGDGIYAALKNIDTTLTHRYFSELPEAGVELYAEEEALNERGLTVNDIAAGIKLANREKIAELLAQAEVSLVF